MYTSRKLQELKLDLENRGYLAQFNQYGDLEGWFKDIHFLYGDDNGCGVVDKPNGTNKWYYEKTVKQFNRILKDVEECNGYNR